MRYVNSICYWLRRLVTFGHLYVSSGLTFHHCWAAADLIVEKWQWEQAITSVKLRHQLRRRL